MLIAAVLIVVAWELVARSSLFNDLLFPNIETTAEAFWDLTSSGVMVSDTVATLGRLILGFIIGASIGVLLGLVTGRLSVAEEMLIPLVLLLLPLPALALMPLLTIWFGVGGTATVILVAFSSALPVAVNTWGGVKGVKPLLIQAAESMRVRGRPLFRKVILPASLPSVITGLRIGLSTAWRAVIAGELISAASSGLGIRLFSAREFLRTDRVFAVMIVIAVIGLLVERTVFIRIERATLVRWGMVSD